MIYKIKKYSIVFISFIMLFSLIMFAACNNKSIQLEKEPTVKLNYESVKVTLGDELQLTASPKNFEIKSNVIQWSSFDENIASVDSNGLVIAKQSGTTSIIAQIGNYSGHCDVVVEEPVQEKNDLTFFLSKNVAVLNVNSNNKSVLLEAELKHNGEIVKTDVNWNSSDCEYATVTNGLVKAIKNGKEVTITATTTYQGNTLSALCKVYVGDFTVIVPKINEIVLYPNENVDVDFDLYLNGQLNNNDKSNVSYSVVDSGIVKVSEEGEITGLKSGKTVLNIMYQNATIDISVIVGELNYIKNAYDFIKIDGAEKYSKYVLLNDVDFAQYCINTPQIDKKYLIEKFNGYLEGNGHSISGYNRFSSSHDKGFLGLFNVIDDSATIYNVEFDVTIENKDSASLIAAYNYGNIKNCLFRISGVTSFTSNNTLFELSNGNVDTCVFIINYCNDATSSTLSVANNGYGTYKDVRIVCSSQIIQSSGCGAYISEQALNNENVLSNNVFVFDDGIHLKGYSSQAKKRPEITINDDVLTASIAEEIDLPQPTNSENYNISYKIFDIAKKDLTDICYKDAKYSIPTKGTYYLLYIAEKDGVYNTAIKEIFVAKSGSLLKTRSLVLKPDETFNLDLNDESISSLNFYSSDDNIVSIENAEIKAKECGQATITIIDTVKNEKDIVLVRVVSDFTLITTKDELLSINNRNGYFVLGADIELSSNDFIEKELTNDNGTISKFKFAIEDFTGVLDGQGYNVTLIIDNYKDAALCGLFYRIGRGATVRNLNYYTKATYSQYAYAAYQSAFVRTLAGNMENCYIKAELYPLEAPNDSMGLIGYFQCETGFANTANINNCIFDMKTIYNGVPQDVGYAIRVGFAPYGYAYDSIFIRNGLTATFFGDHGYRGSAVECKNSNFYKTIYDFVNAYNGYNYSTAHIATKINDGEQLYIYWPNEWRIEDDAIYLCGRKITDVKHEAYVESKTITISDNLGVLSWISSANEFDVYVNDVKVITTKSKSFDIYNYILENYGVNNSSYRVLIKSSTTAGVCQFNIIQLNNSNFVQTMNEFNTYDKAQFNYLVLSENINLTWSHAGNGFMFSKSYANVDGRGYSINVTANPTSTFRGFIHNCYGLWSNIFYKMDATYKYDEAYNRAYFVGSFGSGGLVNSYINISAHPTDNNGTPVKDDLASIISDASNFGTYKNNLFVLDGDAGTVICLFGKYGSGGPNMENCAIVRNGDSHEMALSFGPYPQGSDKGIKNCVHYQTLEEFVKGNGVRYHKPVNILTPTIEPVTNYKLYESWGAVWEIESKGIYLCDRKIISFFDFGDDLLTDSQVDNLQ